MYQYKLISYDFVIFYIQYQITFKLWLTKKLVFAKHNGFLNSIALTPIMKKLDANNENNIKNTSYPINLLPQATTYPGPVNEFLIKNKNYIIGYLYEIHFQKTKSQTRRVLIEKIGNILWVNIYHLIISAGRIGYLAGWLGGWSPGCVINWLPRWPTGCLPGYRAALISCWIFKCQNT